MNDAEIIRRIDAGANHYISLLGNAAHMVSHDTGHYSYVHPKAGEQGISFVYDIRVDDLDAAALELVATLPEYRRRGFARAVCAKALREEITCGAALFTVRANGAASARVYRSLGFRVYNHAL